MTLPELQAAAEAAWITLGSVGHGVVITENKEFNWISVELTAGEGECRFTMQEIVTRHCIESTRGDPRLNYMKTVIQAIRGGISAYYRQEIQLKISS